MSETLEQKVDRHVEIELRAFDGVFRDASPAERAWFETVIRRSIQTAWGLRDALDNSNTRPVTTDPATVPRVELDSLANGYWLLHRDRTELFLEKVGRDATPELLDQQVGRDPFFRAAVATLKPGFLAGLKTSSTVANAIAETDEALDRLGRLT